MASKTKELINTYGELRLREFYCGDCDYYHLTYIQEDYIECPSCFKTIEPNEDFIITNIKSLDENDS